MGEWDIDGYEEIVFEAINFNPRSVQFASEEIRNNPEIMEAAIEQCGDAIECAGESLLNDPKSYYLKLMAVRQWGGALGCLSESDKNDEDLVLEALYGSEDDIDPSSVFGYMGNELKEARCKCIEYKPGQSMATSTTLSASTSICS